MTVLAEGKTKIIHDVGDGKVMIESKDDITAGDGAKHDVLEGKAAASTRTTCNVFELLEGAGVLTHYINRVNETCFTARNARMIPLELVVRRYATGSYLNRHPDLADGTVFDPLVFEVFEKDDDAHDPLLGFDFNAGVLRRYVANSKAAKAIAEEAVAGDLISQETLAGSRFADITEELLTELQRVTLAVFETLEAAWARQGGVLIDFKIECGYDAETGELLVADVIDNDSWRLRFGDTEMSKQNYRDGVRSLPELKKDFATVADATDAFV